MCQCNPNKKCLRQLDVKYLAFEAIKSGCGAELTVQLVNRDGTLAAPEAAAGMYVQVLHVSWNSVTTAITLLLGPFSHAP